MPVFLERFILPVLAAALITIIVLNPLKLDRHEQISLAIIVVGVAYFVGHQVYKLNRPQKPPEVVRETPPQPPEPESHVPEPTKSPKQQEAGLPPKREAKTTAPPDKDVPISPQPVVSGVRIASQKTVPSTRAEFPYALEVVLHTDESIQPVSFLLECDGEVGFIDGGVQGQGVMMNYKMGVVIDNKSWAAFMWSFPPFTASNPIVVTLWSKQYIKALAVRQIPFQ